MTTSPPPVAPQPQPAKPFWRSAAFWYNALCIAVLACEALSEADLFDDTAMGVLLAITAIGNILIRRLSTAGPMTWKTPIAGPAMPRPEWTLDIETMRQLVALYDDEHAKPAISEEFPR